MTNKGRIEALENRMNGLDSKLDSIIAMLTAQDTKNTSKKSGTSKDKAEKKTSKRATKSTSKVEEKRSTYRGVTTVSQNVGVRGGFVPVSYETEDGKSFKEYADAKTHAKDLWCKAQGITKKDREAYGKKGKAENEERLAKWEEARAKFKPNKELKAFLKDNPHCTRNEAKEYGFIGTRDDLKALKASLK